MNVSVFSFRPPLKRSLFPVQRVAEIVANRAAAKSFLFLVFFGFFAFGKKIIFDPKFLFDKNEKKVLSQH